MAQERLDKIIASMGRYSRREVKQLVKEGLVLADGKIVRSAEEKYDAETVEITVSGEVLSYRRFTYVMLHKPAGVLSATEDGRGETVLDLLPKECRKMGLFPVGRLDKDTEGLLLLTNDGELANHLTHPSHEVNKRYLVIVEGSVTADEVKKLEKGLFIEGGKTAPAKVKILKCENGKTELTIIIHEGRNHQVKKMFEAVEKRVVFLKRISVGDINLGQLKKGEYRKLTDEEITYLKSL